MNWLKHPITMALWIVLLALGFGWVLLTYFATDAVVQERRLAFLYAAYTISFLGIYVYLRSIDIRTAKVREEMENLKKEIEYTRKDSK